MLQQTERSSHVRACGFYKELNGSFESVCERIPGVPGKFGFGVIGRIDIGARHREKPGVEFRK